MTTAAPINLAATIIGLPLPLGFLAGLCLADNAYQRVSDCRPSLCLTAPGGRCNECRRQAVRQGLSLLGGALPGGMAGARRLGHKGQHLDRPFALARGGGNGG